MGYETNLIDPDAAWVRLTYTVDGRRWITEFRLVTSQRMAGAGIGFCARCRAKMVAPLGV